VAEQKKEGCDTGSPVLVVRIKKGPDVENNPKKERGRG